MEPPPYLQQLSPELYRQESERVTARFDEAVRLTEQAFLDELSGLLSHLTERLAGAEDGKPKVFRDSAVENLREFAGDPGVEKRLWEIKENDPDHKVREQADDALRKGPLTPR